MSPRSGCGRCAPFGCQSDEARARPVVEREEVELACPACGGRGAWPPRCACRCVVQLLLRREGGAVDALQLRVALVAAPVGARDRQHLERLDVARALDVRAAAEVDEVAVLEVARPPRPPGIDSMISTLYFSPRDANRSSASSRGTTWRSNGRFSATIFAISASMLRGVLGRERLGVEVVVEAGLDRGADRDLRVRAASRRTASAITCDAECRMRDNGSSGTSPLSRGRMARSASSSRVAARGRGRGQVVGTGGIEPPTPTVSR